MPRPRLAVVGSLALGAVAAPYLIGAAALLMVGDLMRSERNWNESWRGRIALVLTAAVGGLLSWLPDPWRLGAIVPTALVVTLLAYVPTLLVDARIGIARAVARSIDFTCRADARSLASAVALSGYLVAAPSFLSYVRSLGGSGYSLHELDGVFVASVVSVSLGVVVAVGACIAIGSISMAATRRPARRLSTLGVGLALVTTLVVVWLAVAPALLVRFERSIPVASVPVAVVIDGIAGPFVVMRRSDGREFAVILHREDGTWWVDTVDPAGARTGALLRSSPFADDAHAVVQARATTLVALAFVLLAGFAYFHVDWLRRMLRRSHVARVRLSRHAIAGTPNAMLVPAGAQLFAVDVGQPACVEAPIPISGTLLPDFGPDDWLEASLVTRGPWSTTSSYRAGLAAPGAGARLMLGDPNDALDEARLADFERLVVALSLTPLLAIGVAFVS